VELEIAGCGDLILRTEDNSEAYVFEFKVGSPLQFRNQDPRNPEFFISGYGAGIKGALFGTNATYILVQNDPEDLSKVREKSLLCRAKSWRDVYKCCHNHPLVHDLFESFGKLDIPAFIQMNTKNMSLGHGKATVEAVKIHKLLEAIAGQVGSRKTKVDVKMGSQENGYIGMKFLTEGEFC